MTLALDAALAARFAAIALDNVAREYPHKLDHVMGSPADVLGPRALHPAFHGSFDWHSCVHMHWLLVRLRRRHPALAHANAIEAVLDRHLAPAPIAGEVAYLQRPASATFERTYGWAWLLKLAEELARCGEARAARWSAALAPLAQAIVARWLDHLPKARHPQRGGLHGNSAFGLAFALDYAVACAHDDLASACRDKALAWYGNDRDSPAGWEPSGSDFLSPALVEADLMRRVLAADAFGRWLEAFLPGLARGEPASLFEPVAPTDRSDGQIVHLDGLNLSRAWCFRGVADALPGHDPRAAVARHAAEDHIVAGMAGVASADYMGAHWLASFAALAIDGA